jgi:muramoyltetrapeptide carboxypeptidase
MDLPTVHPKALKRGDTVAIIAPAGPSSNRQGLQQAIITLERLGFRVRYSERIFDSIRYLAGGDDERAEELMGAFEDPEVNAILPLRGGYGCARLVPLLDEKRLRPNCKIFMGYSDITTLHLYFRRRFGWVTFHGPMALSACLADPVPEQEKHLLSLLTDPLFRPSFSFPELEIWTPGTAEGKLTGGCLSLIAASIGTSYEIRTEGKILFLEEVEEPPYRLDRMVTQLRLAGKLDGLAGLILGSFLNCDPEEGNYTAAETLKEIIANKEFPVIANFPAGHARDNWAFPLGVRVQLDAAPPRICLLEPAVS